MPSIFVNPSSHMQYQWHFVRAFLSGLYQYWGGRSRFPRIPELMPGGDCRYFLSCANNVLLINLSFSPGKPCSLQELYNGKNPLSSGVGVKACAGRFSLPVVLADGSRWQRRLASGCHGNRLCLPFMGRAQSPAVDMLLSRKHSRHRKARCFVMSTVVAAFTLGMKISSQ